LLNNLHKWYYHPHFEFPLKSPAIYINFDLSSDVTARDSGNPDVCFRQLIKDKKIDSSEISIFTDGSRMYSDEGNCDVGCAVIIPSLKVNYMYKLNNFSSSYTAEAIAILQALDEWNGYHFSNLAMNEKWISINICSDSLSLLVKLKTDLSSVFLLLRQTLILL